MKPEIACLLAVYIGAGRNADWTEVDEMITTTPWPSFLRMKQSIARWVARIKCPALIFKVLNQEVESLSTLSLKSQRILTMAIMMLTYISETEENSTGYFTGSKTPAPWHTIFNSSDFSW